MRCYFIIDGRIGDVEFLKEASDEGLITQARELFDLKGKPRGAEGFEVWDGPRFLYRYPEVTST